MDTRKEVEQPLIFFPSHAPGQWTKVIGSVPGAVSLEGTAASAKVGPQLGSYEIYVSRTAYMFCILLPGVDIHGATFGFEVKPLGEVTIRGKTIVGSLVRDRRDEILNVFAKGLPGFGSFSITFRLPGPVRVRTVATCSSTDGILWAVIDKQEEDLTDLPEEL